jgi:hypothetical protein
MNTIMTVHDVAKLPEGTMVESLSSGNVYQFLAKTSQFVILYDTELCELAMRKFTVDETFVLSDETENRIIK